MKIQEFINTIPFTILSRGQQYFNNNYVHDIKKGRNGNWYAEVEGNYGYYKTIIEMDAQANVEDYSCNCPFEGDICKHIAAVALSIEDENTIFIDTEEEHNSIEELLKDAKTNDLKNFIYDYAERNHEFMHELKLVFSKPESIDNSDNIGYYTDLISEIFETHSDYGFLDYRSGIKAMGDIEELFHKADLYYNKNNHNEAFSIAAAIATEALGALENMDDSSGECGGAISRAFEIINMIFFNTSDTNLKERIFNWLEIQVKNSDYYDYGVNDESEPLFFDAAIALKKYESAYNIIDNQLKELEKSDDWSKKYKTTRYLGYKIKVLNDEGKNHEAENIIDNNIHIDKFREIRVKQFWDNKQYADAEKLVHDGIEIAVKENYAGTIHNWKDKLLELYKLQGKDTEISNLARELFTENSSQTEYYKTYKQTINPEKWIEQRNKLIKELKNIDRGHYKGIPLDDMASIYIEEQMTDELFEIVAASNNIKTLIQYTPQLKSKYNSELIEYYKAAIEISARHTGRDVYSTLVYYLKQMAKLNGGKETAIQLKNDLLNKYKNRPAMKDEFRLLGWD